MTAERIVVPGLGRLPFFSHATAVGDLVFVSGLLGTKPGTIELAAGGTGPETTQALRNIEQVLVAARSSLAQIAKVNVYLADMKTYDEMNRAYMACFEGLGQPPPARITVGGARLALGANVEIDCVAWRSGAAPAQASIARATGFVESGGERVYYEVHGDGDPVVLCHGAGGNHVAWYLQVPEFARSYRVVTWDQRGFGRTSNRAGQATPASAVADLVALLDHLGLARAHVIGQSMGGWAALGLALALPQRVHSLVLADTLGGIWTPRAVQEFEALVERSGGLRADALPLGRHPAIDASLLERDPAHAFLYQELQSLNDPPPADVALHLRATAHPPEALGRLALPVLFVVGDRDPIFPPAVIRDAAAQIPGARVVEIPGSGHSPYFEKPREWNDAVLAFLRAS
jgi:reactive intermediate/imine deaminase